MTAAFKKASETCQWEAAPVGRRKHRQAYGPPGAKPLSVPRFHISFSSFFIQE
jgi:hypothetical protein